LPKAEIQPGKTLQCYILNVEPEDRESNVDNVLVTLIATDRIDGKKNGPATGSDHRCASVTSPTCDRECPAPDPVREGQ
jgi:hypothetical protein